MIVNTLSFLTRPIFPAQCFHCSASLSPMEQSICQICLASLPKIDPVAGHRLQLLTRSLSSAKPSVFKASLYFTEPVQTLCYSLKYGSNPFLARTLGKAILAPLILQSINLQNHPGTAYICPMPVHWRRRMKRGYNQSEELARGIKAGLQQAGYQSKLAPLLTKPRHKKSQITMSNFSRWTNTAEAFQAARRGKKNQRVPEDALVILIDDTVTTGASMLHAAEALIKAYPKIELHLFALAQEI